MYEPHTEGKYQIDHSWAAAQGAHEPHHGCLGKEQVPVQETKNQPSCSEKFQVKHITLLMSAL